MTVIYRILSFFINLFSLLIVMMLLILIPLSLGAPALWLPIFMLVAVVLYSAFSTWFRHKVLTLQQQVKHNLKDWIRVNGIVTLVFCCINIPSVIMLLRNPSFFINNYKEIMKEYSSKMQQEIPMNGLSTLAVIMLIYFIALFTHVLWTFMLIKKHESFFEKNQSS